MVELIALLTIITPETTPTLVYVTTVKNASSVLQLRSSNCSRHILIGTLFTFVKNWVRDPEDVQTQLLKRSEIGHLILIIHFKV